ncbi:MAG: hypothetical protein H6747_12840 [Deltaproteobacteria bacterium]|nr:hypothetical protein [Deltaproteobacteria bacterium]
MKRLLGLQGFSLLIILGWMLPNLATTYVYPDEIGVRRSLFGGIEEQDFQQGRWLDVPMVHSWYRLPRTLHYLEFADADDLDVRTREGNLIHVDLVIVYKIKDGAAHTICREGMATSYPHRVRSAVEGFLLKHMASMSNKDIQDPDVRIKTALSAIGPLNQRLSQYHVEVVEEGVVIRAISFDAPYEERLQAKQLYAVQAELDVAEQRRSEGKQATDTVQKGIDKEVAVERENWNERVELARRVTETMIAEVDAEALEYDRRVRAEADAEYDRLVAEGERAELEAQALGEKLRAEALTTKAGRIYAAIEAVRAFELGQIELNSLDPGFLQRFGSMASWRRFFGGE